MALLRKDSPEWEIRPFPWSIRLGNRAPVTEDIRAVWRVKAAGKGPGMRAIEGVFAVILTKNKKAE